MKYIRNFSAHTDYVGEMSKIPTPSVSYCRKENECHFFMPNNVIMFKVGDLNGNTNQTVTVNYDNGSETIPITEGNKWYVHGIPSGKSLKQLVGIDNITDTIISAKLAKEFNSSILSNIRGNVSFIGCSTSEVTSMNSMFDNCYALETLGVSNLDTSKVRDFTSMFYECRILKNLDVRNWNTSSATSMCAMFKSCESLQNLCLSGWDVSSVTSMYDMFDYCYALETLDLSNWNTSKVRDMGEMFGRCRLLKTLDLSGWDTSNATVRGMFDSCDSLKTILMRGCNQTTIDKIKAQLEKDYILDNVTIITE